MNYISTIDFYYQAFGKFLNEGAVLPSHSDVKMTKPDWDKHIDSLLSKKLIKIELPREVIRDENASVGSKAKSKKQK